MPNCDESDSQWHQRSPTSVMPATEVTQHRFQSRFGNIQKAPSPLNPNHRA